ncbi:MAG: hypothetical protein ACHP7J_00110 [Terriglobales bacterium]
MKSWTFTTAGTTGDVITISIGSKSVSYTTTSGTIATFIPLLLAYLQGLSTTVYPEFAEVTWSATSPTLTATDNTAGKPSVISVSTNSASTTINSGAVTGATNATPIVITATAHGLANGSVVTIAGVLTNTNANGTWIISAVTANTFTLTGSVGNGAFGAGSPTWANPNGSTTTVSSGPKSIRTAANYSTGNTPATGDTLYVDLEGSQLLYDLDFFSAAYGNAVVVAVRRITAQSVTIGLPQTNVDGTAYTEYRPQYWQMTATSDYVNCTNSGRIKLDDLTGQTTFECDGMGTGLDSNSNIPALLLCGTHASNAWTLNAGVVGFAFFAADSARVHTGTQKAGATVVCGIGCVNDTWNNDGGNLTVNSAIATALNHATTGRANTIIDGSGACALVTAQGGVVDYRTTGALAANSIFAGSAVLTFDNDLRTKTVSGTVKVYSQSVRVVDTNRVVSGGLTIQYLNFSPTPRFPANCQIVLTYLSWVALAVSLFAW